jgi:spore coat-associated protein N
MDQPLRVQPAEYAEEPERQRRRRGLLVILLLGSTIATFGAGAMSLAIFTGSDASTGSFTAGTIDITSSPSTLFTVTAMMPGDSTSATLTVTNSGTAQLRYAMTSSATNGDGLGLRDQLTLTIEAGSCASPGATIYSGPLNGASFGDVSAGDDLGDRTLDAPGSEDLCFTVDLPWATPDAYEGATTTATFTFNAEQTANNL